MFENMQRGPVDPMFDLKKVADNDTSPEKVDLGVGIYRNEEGYYHEMEVLKVAKKTLNERNPGHDYECTTGSPEFLKRAAQVMFGEKSQALRSGRVASVQTISGTGANHLAALLLSKCEGSQAGSVYIGTPAWGNYEPLCSLVGLKVVRYPYYDPETATVNFKVLLETVTQAPPNCVFILQGCCHNPTGVDLSKSQWKQLAAAMKNARCFPFMDIAYQGLGSSMEDDAYGIRLFAEMEFEMLVCQSFSKNLGLYGERCGALHVVCSSSTAATNVYDQLRCLIRWEFSSSPLYGARLADIILKSSSLQASWSTELSDMRQRLLNNRKQLFEALQDVPRNWDVILATKGLFWCELSLSKTFMDFGLY
ncbi:hypothetical protein AbraCBS73388_004637 [Aspergillus brasiliensis]|uniref:Aminotransferase class I/classII large domain-containing protein n=1 Tax=Aspergillus brasiliensis TaxID=319629 RepID=A0A9W5Z116_9EURO|nr:hypothetical protein AbraCBS73388_004637 [Aspergillus brasiliensis]